MSPVFAVRSLPRTERLLRKLNQKHPELRLVLREVATILESDPYNRSRSHNIKKLESVAEGTHGQWRLRLGRWRFRYDIDGKTVVLYYAGLRREDTYRSR